MIEYTFDAADLGRFATYAIANEPSHRRTARNVQLTTAMIWFCVTGALGTVAHSALVAIGVAVIGILFVWHARYAYRDRLAKALVTAAHTCIDGPHFLEANASGLHVRCTISDTWIRWGGIRGVSETASHVFVHVENGGTCVVPRSKVQSGDAATLVSEIRGYLAQRGA